MFSNLGIRSEQNLNRKIDQTNKNLKKYNTSMNDPPAFKRASPT